MRRSSISHSRAVRTEVTLLTIALLSILPIEIGPSTVIRAQPAELGLEPGDQVRISAPSVSPHILEGTISQIAEGKMRVGISGERGLRDLLFRDITDLHVLRTQSQQGRGALLGMAAGGLIMGTWAARSFQRCESSDSCTNMLSDGSKAFLAGAALGAIPGLFVGAIIGSRSKTRTWEHINLDIALAPTGTAARGTAPRLAPSFRLVIPLGG